MKADPQRRKQISPKEHLRWWVLLAALAMVSCGPGDTSFRSGKVGDYSFEASCEYTGTETYTPYVSIRLGQRLLVKAAVDQGYDTVHDCEASSVSSVETSEDGNSFIIRKPDGSARLISLTDTGPS